MGQRGGETVNLSLNPTTGKFPCYLKKQKKNKEIEGSMAFWSPFRVGYSITTDRPSYTKTA